MALKKSQQNVSLVLWIKRRPKTHRIIVILVVSAVFIWYFLAVYYIFKITKPHHFIPAKTLTLKVNFKCIMHSRNQIMRITVL